MLHKILEVIGLVTVLAAIVAAIIYAGGRLIVKILNDTHASRD